MKDFIKQDLSKEEPTEFQTAMLEHVKGLVEGSRRTMCSYYDTWDALDEVYQKERTNDEEDKQAKLRKEPVKQIVPTTYAQIQTFIAFCMSLYFQREYFYELVPLGVESHNSARIGESLLQRDLSKNNWTGKLYQHLMDVGKFGLGVFKYSWEERTRMVKVTQEGADRTFFGLTIGKEPSTEVEERRPVWQGNKIDNISPFRFFPDTRLPLSRFQEGEFVASEDEYPVSELYGMQHDNVIQGVKYIKPLKLDEGGQLLGKRRLSNTTISKRNSTDGLGMSSTVVVTEVQVKIIPAQFMVNNKPLGPEEYPVKYLVWYANDSRLLRVEPLQYEHDEFTYSLSEFNPDQHHFVNNGLATVIDSLQDAISWFLNSRITSVRKMIQNWLIVDPNGVEMSDIKNRRPIIRMKATASRLGVDKFIKQLNLNDVTQNHVSDVQFLQQLLYSTTGINDTALGQFHKGRRSATEARNVFGATASRLKMLAQLIYYSGIEPGGRQLLSNLQNGLTMDTYIRTFGMDMDPDSSTGVGGFEQFIKVNNDSIRGELDFELFDGTLPSEKAYIADVIQESLTTLAANPIIAPAVGLDVRELFFEMLELKGMRHPQRFAVPPQMDLLLNQQNGLTGNAGTASTPGGGSQSVQPSVAGGTPSGNGNAGGQSAVSSLVSALVRPPDQ